MTTVRENLKFALFNYPSLYSNPIDVAKQWFSCNGNGLQWNNKGQLGDMFTEKSSKVMLYDDLEERIKNSLEYDCIGNRVRLEVEADRVKRDFVAKNIEAILDEGIAVSYFGSVHRPGYYFTKGVYFPGALGFNFPDNIAKDWGDALYSFFDTWLVALNIEYGVSAKDFRDISFWPQEAQNLRAEILKQRSRLFPLINDGITYEEHCESNRKLMDEIMCDIKKDDC
jgi:hypothetical protein